MQSVVSGFSRRMQSVVSGFSRRMQSVVSGFSRIMRSVVSGVSRIAAVLLLAGCAGPTQPDRVPKGEPFALRVGESALTTDDIRITFDTVRSDSRCPMDAICVRAGEAVMAVTLSRDGEMPVGRELDTTPARSSTTFLNFAITLSQLQPYPRSDRQIQPSDYVATFVVSVR